MANYRIREIEMKGEFSDEVTLGAMDKVVSRTQIMAILTGCGVEATRVKKMDMLLTVMVVIGMGLYQRISIGTVMKKIVQGVRLLWGDGEYEVAGDSAISTRRYQLGSAALKELFKAVCRPMATPQTQGAFFEGLRLMAIDGAQQDVPDLFGVRRFHFLVCELSVLYSLRSLKPAQPICDQANRSRLLLGRCVRFLSLRNVNVCLRSLSFWQGRPFFEQALSRGAVGPCLFQDTRGRSNLFLGIALSLGVAVILSFKGGSSNLAGIAYIVVAKCHAHGSFPS